MLVLRKSVQRLFLPNYLIAIKIFVAMLQMRKRLIQLQKFDMKRIFVKEEAQREQEYDISVKLLVSSFV